MTLAAHSDWPSRRSPAPDHVSTWSPRLIGGLAHQAVQRLCAHDQSISDPRSAMRLAARFVPELPAITHRLMVAQRLSQAVWLWCTLFDPRPDWQFLGAELFVADAPIDLLWVRAGRVRADELKLAPIGGAARRQAQTIGQGASESLGRAFDGVRLISLLPSSPQAIWIGAGEWP